MTNADIGAAVRDARLRQGLTQEKLAQKAGVRREWLTRLEQGAPGPDFTRLTRVLTQLHLALALVPLPQLDAELSHLREHGGLFSEE